MTRVAEMYRRLHRLARRMPWPKDPRWRKPAVAVSGVGIMAAGVLMIVLPGPAILVIPLGLVVLALEFSAVRHWMRRARRFTRKTENNS